MRRTGITPWMSNQTNWRNRIYSIYLYLSLIYCAGLVYRCMHIRCVYLLRCSLVCRQLHLHIHVFTSWIFCAYCVHCRYAVYPYNNLQAYYVHMCAWILHRMLQWYYIYWHACMCVVLVVRNNGMHNEHSAWLKPPRIRGIL